MSEQNFTGCTDDSVYVTQAFARLLKYAVASICFAHRLPACLASSPTNWRAGTCLPAAAFGQSRAPVAAPNWFELTALNQTGFIGEAGLVQRVISG